MIKSKSDVQKLMNNLKESENTISYTTDNDLKSIKFNEQEQFFQVTIQSNLTTKFKLNGNYSESGIIELLFLDRKYINKSLKRS